MKEAGPALIGLGRGSGEHRASDAARQAIASPLLEARFEGAHGILFNVSGPADLRLGEVRAAADEIRAHAADDANIIFGASFSESLGEDVLVTLMATGLNGHESAEAKPSPRRAGRAKGPASTAVVEPTTHVASDAAPESPTIDDDDFEVPSFLRRNGRDSRARAVSPTGASTAPDS